MKLKLVIADSGSVNRSWGGQALGCVMRQRRRCTKGGVLTGVVVRRRV